MEDFLRHYFLNRPTGFLQFFIPQSIEMPTTGSELELQAHRVRMAAPEALRSLLYLLQSPAVADVFYAVRGRVKTIDGIMEKVERKRREEPESKSHYEPQDITDIVGVRVVTLFREDVIEALKIFISMIKCEKPYDATSPFVSHHLKEAIIFTTVPVGDPEALVSRLTGVLETSGFPPPQVKQIATGYSSVHLVAYCHADDGQKIPVEIQIRTVFEDAWGEIDHKLRYSAKRRQPINPEGVIASWQPHLNVMKTFIDGCAQYAGLIKKHAIDANKDFGYFSESIVPAEKFEDVLKEIKGLPEEVIDKFKYAFELREEARNLGDSTDSSAAFSEAAKAFDAVLKAIANAE